MNAVEERKPIRLERGVEEMTFDEAFEEFQDLVYKLAHRKGRFMEFDDACQIARCGLWEAYKDYNRTSTPFGSFAKTVMDHALYHEWEKANRPIRKCAQLVYLDAPIPDTDNLCYDDLMPSHDELDELIDSLDIANILESNFTDRERRIIQGIIDGYQQVEIRHSIGKSHSTMANYMKQVRQTLREALYEDKEAAQC